MGKKGDKKYSVKWFVTLTNKKSNPSKNWTLRVGIVTHLPLAQKICTMLMKELACHFPAPWADWKV